MVSYHPDIPLSLYVHLPWCVRKCPYCDFNSHAAKGNLPEALYVEALLQELDTRLPLIQGRPLISIFFGGGTPSLFSAEGIAQILTGVRSRVPFAPDIEITLEANPGTLDQGRFRGYRQAGVNRLSIGVQSMQNDKLITLGRIHDNKHAHAAIEFAKEAGYGNFNLDIMYGLPAQSLEDAMHDIRMALAHGPTHFSWYQLTIEPNTFFHHQPPSLPHDEAIWDSQLAGQQVLKDAGYVQYEVSAYSLPGHACRHNMNYWEFGDYLGIGAGAHSKITDYRTGEMLRFSQIKHPQDYLIASKRNALTPAAIADKDRVFEFMLNTLRLTQGVPASLFTERTGLPLTFINPVLMQARERGLLTADEYRIQPTEMGMRYLNDLTGLFL